MLVKIGDDVKIPEGWEAVEFRKPRHGDEWMHPNGNMAHHDPAFDLPKGYRLILKRKFDVEALKEKLRALHPVGTWFAKDKEFSFFYSFPDRPIASALTHNGYRKASCQNFSVEWPPGDWEDSLFQI